MENKYKTPGAYKSALESKLKNRAKGLGRKFERERQIFIFDRFLRRLSSHFPNRFVVKGGFALELRLDNARSTKDIDLSMTGSAENLLEELQIAGSKKLNDFLRFEISKPKKSRITNEGLQYEGVRFRVECKLSEKTYGNAFGIDIVFGSFLGKSETIETTNYLEIAGTQTHHLELYPIEAHIAEKLHAYTSPGSSRIKDFPDIAILASIRNIDGKKLRESIVETFAFRNTYSLPKFFPQPPPHWGNRYKDMVSLNQLKWENIDDLFLIVSTFLNPVLGGDYKRSWDPQTWSWK